MSITDKLREWASIEVPYKYGHQLNAIADRIDAEHQKAIRELNNLADASVLLPADADGVRIRVGDVMESKDCRLLFGETSFEVRSMRCDECGWEIYDRLGDRYAPSLLRHHTPDTWESIIKDAIGEGMARERGNKECCDHSGALSNADLVARCKAMVGDAE